MNRKDVASVAETERQSYSEMIRRWLPIEGGDTIWTANRRSIASDPDQGWKIHVSANILNACRTLETVVGELRGTGLMYKAPKSLMELVKLNRGLETPYSQIGKFITIYSRSSREAVNVSKALHEATEQFEGPIVPFDERVAETSNVYLRYGCFRPTESVTVRGRKLDVLVGPRGGKHLDKGRLGPFRPPFVRPLFAHPSTQSVSPLSFIRRGILPVETIIRRGKGGVFRMLDVSSDHACLRILKVGLRGGECEWDGRDGYWRLENEIAINRILSEANVAVPRLLEVNRSNTAVLATYEHLPGRLLSRFITDRSIGMRNRNRVAYALVDTLEAVHRLGIALRDIKPQNIFISPKNQYPTLTLIDFEGACRLSDSAETYWGTPSYLPEDGYFTETGDWREQDRFAMACTCIDILSGKSLPTARDRYKWLISSSEATGSMRAMLSSILSSRLVNE